MKKPASMNGEPAGGTALPSLSVSVQYATEAPGLPRWRLRRWVQRAVEYAAREEQALLSEPRFLRVELALRLVDSTEGQALNREYRDKDYATNVLTFEYGIDADGTASGDIVLCVPVLYREAAEQGKPLLAHAAHLTTHGALHALGYDHEDEDDALAMEALETRILASLGIPDPYKV